MKEQQQDSDPADIQTGVHTSMLTEITLENFKGYRERTTIPLAPITLLYGPNSAGKSSIFHALLFAYEVLKNDWCDVDISSLAPVDLGGFLNLVNKNSDDRSITIGLRFNHTANLPDSYYRAHRSDDLDAFSAIHGLGIVALTGGSADPGETAIVFRVQWSNKLSRPYVSLLDISIMEEPLLSIRTDDALEHTIVCDINFDSGWFHVDIDAETTPLARIIAELLYGAQTLTKPPKIEIPIEPGPAGAKPLLGRPVRLGLVEPALGRMNNDFWGPNGEDETRSDEEKKQYYIECVRVINVGKAISEFFTQAIVAQIEAVVELIGSMASIGPMRTVPPRNFSPRRRTDPSRWYEGLAAWDAVANCDDDEFQRISQWMFRLKTRYTISRNPRCVARDGDQPAGLGQATRVVLRDLKGNEFFAPDVGIGISQLLPVVAATCLAAVRIVYVEQPELHIHPALQVELGDLVCAHVPPFRFRTGDPRTPILDDGKHFLFETHSEHLLLRILKRIRQTTEGEIPDPQLELYPNDVAVIYIDNRQGNSTAQELRIDNDGEFLDRWPTGFFAERSDELF